MSERRLHIPERFRETVAEPDWYNRLGRLRGVVRLGLLAVRNRNEVLTDANSLTTVRAQAKSLLVKTFAKLLAEDAVALGVSGPNWDESRLPIDTIVVHHTGNGTPVDLHYLNALHLLRLYAPKYQNPGGEAAEIGGLPIYSGHFDDAGKQVFYGYHWLVRSDGTREHLLPDKAIGWQAGNWEMNRRSVAVCFDGDFEQGRPTDEAIETASELIAERYGKRSNSIKILGHNAIVETICPGSEFELWGEEIRALVEAKQA